MVDERIRPVILSGGAGTRLWPISVRARPKQLLPLAGARPMVVETAGRVADRQRFSPPLIVAGIEHGDQIATLLEEAAAGSADPPQAPAGLILEPSGRNTAPAMALAAHWVLGRDSPDTLMLVMPSDHVIADRAAFRAAIDAGAPLARNGWLVTFGISADRPETGYGYIERGQALDGRGFAVARFVEKPDRPTAESYLASGRFDWNAGIFLMRAGSLLDALSAHAPDVASAAAATWDHGAAQPASPSGRFSPDPALWAACPSIAIDVAVMERHDRVAVVPVSMGWSDVGGFDALADLGPHDAAGNAVAGDVLVLDARGCLLRSQGPLIAAVGVEGLCVVATPDAVLVMPRDRAQDVRRIVEMLKAQGRSDLL